MIRGFNKNKVGILALVFLLVFSNLVGATSSIDGRNIIRTKVDKKDPVTLIIKENNRIHAIDEQVPDEDGFVEFKVNLNKAIEKEKIKVKTPSGEIEAGNLEVEKLDDSPSVDPVDPVDPIDPVDPLEPKEKMISLNIEGYKGNILSKRNIIVSSGESVLDVSKRIMDANGIKYRVKDGYVVSIDNQAEFDKGKGSGWMYSVDGKFPNKGADYVRAKDYKRIEWKYTYDFGKDVGAGSNWMKLDDKSDNKIDEILRLLEDKDIKEKDVLKNLKDLSKEIENIPSSKRLNYGEKIYDSLYMIREKFTSDDISSRVGEIVLKTVKEINKNSDDKEKLAELFSRYLGLTNDLLKDIKSEKEGQELVKTLVEITKELSDKVNSSRRIKRSRLKLNFDNKEKIDLNENLLKEIKKQNIDRISIKNIYADLEFNAEDLIGKTVLNLSKDRLSIKNNDKEISLKNPVKIRIKSASKNKLIKLDDKIIGGLLKEKEILAYNNSLGQLKLEDRKPVTFYDLGNYSWAKEAIDILAGNQVVTGRNSEKFDPSANITRGEFSALVARMLNLDPSGKDLEFKDVKASDWYYTSIKALNEKGYINGRSRDTFDPNGNISREEMAKILGQILEDYDYKDVSEDELKKFTDNHNISNWARPGAALVVRNEALKGSHGNFNPKNKATRAETVTLLYRTYKLILED